MTLRVVSFQVEDYVQNVKTLEYVEKQYKIKMKHVENIENLHKNKPN